MAPKEVTEEFCSHRVRLMEQMSGILQKKKARRL